MKHHRSSLPRGSMVTCLLLALCLAWPAMPGTVAQSAPAATFTVNSTNHQEFGQVTLRQQASYFAAHERTHLPQIARLHAAIQTL